MRGWLLKKGPNKNLFVWKRRYFVLYRRAQKLEYYEDEECHHHLGTCDLLDAIRINESLQGSAVDVPEGGFGFEVVTTTREWILVADNEHTRAAWLMALSRLIPEKTNMEGWLRKQGQGKTGVAWRRRYFFLHPHGLAYYDDEKMANLLGVCDLNSALNVLPVDLGGSAAAAAMSSSNISGGGDEPQPPLSPTSASADEDAASAGPASPSSPTASSAGLGKYGIEIVCMAPARIWHLMADNAEDRDRWLAQLRKMVLVLNTKTVPVFSGYLTKRGERFKSWKRRFFVLLDGLLMYFEDEKNWKQLLREEEDRAAGRKARNFVSQEPKGIIPLRATELVLEKDDLTLYIKTPGRTYHVKAQDEEQKQKWSVKILEALFYSPYNREYVTGSEDDRPQVITDSGYKRLSQSFQKPRVGSQFELQSVGSGDLSASQTQDVLSITSISELYIPRREKLAQCMTDPTLSHFFRCYFEHVWRHEVKQKEDPHIDTHIDKGYVDFWLEAEEFSRVPPGRYQTHLARSIYKLFLAHGADRRILLATQTQEALMSRFAAAGSSTVADFPPNLFRAAQDQILDMLSLDVFPYFLSSPSQWGFQKALRALYYDIMINTRLLKLTDPPQKDEGRRLDPQIASILRNSKGLVQFMEIEAKTRSLYTDTSSVQPMGSDDSLPPFPASPTFASSSSSTLGGSFYDPGGLYMLALWREIDHYSKLPSTMRVARAYSIYEEYIHLSAPRLVKITEHLKDLVTVELQEPDENTFRRLQEILSFELRDLHVLPFTKSALWAEEQRRRAGATPKLETLPLPFSQPPPILEVMQSRPFEAFLREKGVAKYWKCWWALEEFRIRPLPLSDCDFLEMIRRADRVYSMYFSPTSDYDFSEVPISSELVQHQFRHPAKSMFEPVQQKLEQHIMAYYYPLHIACPVNTEESDPPPPPPSNAPREPRLPDLPPRAYPERYDRKLMGHDSENGDAKSRSGNSVGDGDDDGDEYDEHDDEDSDDWEEPESDLPPLPLVVGGENRSSSHRRSGTGPKSASSAKTGTVPFEVILSDPQLSRHFKMYMRRSCSYGSVMLYLLAEEYARLPMGDFDRGDVAASQLRTRIFDQFISDTAPVSVPAISNETRKAVQRNLHASPRPFIFDAVLAQVYRYLKKLYFRPFRRSVYYEALLTEYRDVVLKRELNGIPSHWSPMSRSKNPASLSHLSCGNACWRLFFRRYVERTFCAENYDSFVVCDDFRYVQGHNYRKVRAKQIFDKYISRESVQQVNISSMLYNNIVKNFPLAPSNLFREAQEEVFRMMDTDTMPRFKESEEFMAYKQERLPSASSMNRLLE